MDQRFEHKVVDLRDNYLEGWCLTLEKDGWEFITCYDIWAVFKRPHAVRMKRGSKV